MSLFPTAAGRQIIDKFSGGCCMLASPLARRGDSENI